jgi:flagellar biosynthesis/type III secretory pathway protein FliH
MARVVRGSPPGGRRIEGVVFDAAARARALVAEAEEDARRIRSEAEAERERIRREAEEAGRCEGFARAAAALAAVAAERERRLAALTGELATLALEVARKVLGRELSREPRAVLDLASHALAEARDRREVTLRVNPADAPTLRANHERLAALLERAPGLGVREDVGVEPGGVIVETDAGRVDARVETQLGILERALAGTEP